MLQRDPLPDHPLFVGIADERLERVPIALAQSVFPGIGTEDRLLLLPGLAIEDQRDDARVLHALHGDRLRLLERAIHVDWNPRMPVDDLLLDAEHMHDRVDTRLFVICDLLGTVIWKKPPDPRILLDQRPDEIGVQYRVEYPRRQHALDRLLMRQPRELQVRRRGKFNALVELGEPLDRLMGNTVLVLQDAAHP